MLYAEAREARMADMRRRQEIQRIRASMSDISARIEIWEGKLNQLDARLSVLTGVSRPRVRHYHKAEHFTASEIRDLVRLSPREATDWISRRASSNGVRRRTVLEWLRRTSTAWNLRSREPLAMLTKAG